MRQQISKPATQVFREISERRFIDLYTETLNATAATKVLLGDMKGRRLRDIIDKFTDEDIDQIASRIISLPAVTTAINQKLTEAVQNQRLVTAKWVLVEAQKVYNKCMQTDQIKDRDGDAMTGKFQPVPALRALELVGKHVDIQAFKEVVEVKGGSDLIETLDAARKRIEGDNAKPVVIDQDDDTDIPELPAPDSLESMLA